MQFEKFPHSPAWARHVLIAAGIYNLVWGALIMMAPLALFRWAGMEDPRYPQIWQCVGMIVGVYGIGYCVAAGDPFRHWPIVLVGFLGKIFGPIGFVNSAVTGALPWVWGLTIITNDLIWWIPFATILYLAFRAHTDTAQGCDSLPYPLAIRQVRSHRRASLAELSSKQPTLVLFLRHSGCAFCRESLSELSDGQADLRQLGANLAIVHMEPPLEGRLLLDRYDLGDVHHFSDPFCVLYRAFQLQRGTLMQLFSPRVIWRGIRAVLRGHGLGRLSGDGFRMPGAFVLRHGQIIAEYRSCDAGDRPDLKALLRAAILSDSTFSSEWSASGIGDVVRSQSG